MGFTWTGSPSSCDTCRSWWTWPASRTSSSRGRWTRLASCSSSRVHNICFGCICCSTSSWTPPRWNTYRSPSTAASWAFRPEWCFGTWSIRPWSSEKKILSKKLNVESGSLDVHQGWIFSFGHSMNSVRLTVTGAYTHPQLLIFFLSLGCSYW